MIRENRDAKASGFSQERIEDITGSIRIGKEFAIVLLVKGNADLFEKGDRVRNRKCAQDVSHDRRPSTPEVLFGDYRIRDVAASTAADQDLGPEFSGAIKDGDRAR